MKLLKDHYNNKDTIILHNRIINGCQDFHINYAEEIAEEYNVPSSIMNEAIEFAKIEVDDNFDEFDLDKLIDGNNYKVRSLIAQYGTDEHRDKLIDDEIYNVRLTIAQYGNDKHHLYYIKKYFDSGYLMNVIAQHGSDKVRQKLINHHGWRVLLAIAKYGNDKHREQLIDHPDWRVRRYLK